MDAGERFSDDGVPLHAIEERIEGDDSFALAVVMRTEGSTPRDAGTMALIDETGAINGTIGGGLLEAEAQKRGVEAIRSGIPAAFDFTYHGISAAERDPICGGQMRVLVFPVDQAHHDAFRAAEQARLRRERGLLTIRFERAAKAVVVVGFTIDRGASRRSGVSEERRHSPGGKLNSGGPPTRRHEGASPEAAKESLVVPLIPAPRLLIFGGGHVGQALAQQAELLGFDITVIDDRPEFTAPDRFPRDVATICGPMDAEAARIAMDEDTFVAIVTRGHPQDSAVLARCLHRPTAYLGMMGSHRKVALVRREFIESGRATAEELDRVHAPIGLDLGGETVPEIAASIVAQLIAVRRKRLAARIPSDSNS